MIYQEEHILLQDRVKEDWKGLTFPGGHVEKGESFVHAVKREMYEETGLIIQNPKLCGIKQFQTDQDERYMVLLFKTNEYSGTLQSSNEGEMKWICKADLNQYTLVEDFRELLEVFESDSLNEFMYERSNGEEDWKVKLY